jgi:four helix bundle protein
MLPPAAMGSPRSPARNAWQLSGQLRSEVARLIAQFPLDADPRLHRHLDDAATAASSRIADAFTTGRHQDVARAIRLSLASIADIQEGIRLALLKRACVESDLRELRELLSRLYPALSALLVAAQDPNVRAHRADQRK